MKNIFLTTLFLFLFRFANATLYLIVVGQQLPTLTNLCLGDTLRFSGDSLNQNIYGSILITVENLNWSLNRSCAVLSDLNVATTCDFILIPDDIQYQFTPPIGNGPITFNCLTGLSDELEKLPLVGLYPNPATNKVTISSHLSMQTIILYDVLGNKIIQIKPNSENEILDISNYVTGIYLVEIKINSESIFKKLVKN